MLETSLRAFIEVVNRRFDAHIDAEQIILAEDRQTLGRLIEQLKRHVEINLEFTDALAEALEARNYIAHQFFIRNASAFKDEAACASALRLLDERTNKIVAVAGATSGFTQRFAETFGVKLSDMVARQDI